MALFGIFDKKNCCACGGEIGLMGNRKLADGNLCKNCASKLSPWMTDRRQSTVQEILQHLAYRDQNARMLVNFHPTTAMGGNTKIYLDENAGKFIVTRASNWRDVNPDIIDVSQVIEVRTDVEEHRTEEYHRDREGRNVPFTPPRYRYSYEFDTTIMVDSPYFGEIHFELTEQRPEHQHDEAYNYYEQLADTIRQALMPAPQAAPRSAVPNAFANAFANAKKAVDAARAQAQAAAATPEQWTCTCGAVNSGNFCTQCGSKRPAPVKRFRCDKCGWTPDDPTHPPRFCPNCGDPFNEGDAL